MKASSTINIPFTMTSTLTSTSSPPDNNNELDAAFTQVALSKVRLDSIRVRQRDHAAEADNLEKMAKEEVRKAKSHQASLLNLASSLAEGLRERRADLAAFLREQKVELEAMGARRKTELKELDELHRFAIDKMAKVRGILLAPRTCQPNLDLTPRFSPRRTRSSRSPSGRTRSR